MTHTARLEDLIDAMFTVESRCCRHWWKPLRDRFRVDLSPHAFKLRPRHLYALRQSFAGWPQKMHLSALAPL